MEENVSLNETAVVPSIITETRSSSDVVLIVITAALFSFGLTAWCYCCWKQAVDDAHNIKRQRLKSAILSKEFPLDDRISQAGSKVSKITAIQPDTSKQIQTPTTILSTISNLVVVRKKKRVQSQLPSQIVNMMAIVSAKKFAHGVKTTNKGLHQLPIHHMSTVSQSQQATGGVDAKTVISLQNYTKNSTAQGSSTPNFPSHNSISSQNAPLQYHKKISGKIVAPAIFKDKFSEEMRQPSPPSMNPSIREGAIKSAEFSKLDSKVNISSMNKAKSQSVTGLKSPSINKFKSSNRSVAPSHHRMSSKNMSGSLTVSNKISKRRRMQKDSKVTPKNSSTPLVIRGNQQSKNSTINVFKKAG